MQKAKIILSFLLLCSFFLLNFAEGFAQCAMCRASVSSSISEGTGLAKNLNTGILYLASMPYILIAVLAWLWYRNSKKNHEKINGTSKYA